MNLTSPREEGCLCFVAATRVGMCGSVTGISPCSTPSGALHLALMSPSSTSPRPSYLPNRRASRQAIDFHASRHGSCVCSVQQPCLETRNTSKASEHGLFLPPHDTTNGINVFGQPRGHSYMSVLQVVSKCRSGQAADSSSTYTMFRKCPILWAEAVDGVRTRN